MTHASLFSGIGGFDLAAEWAGWTNVFNCEIDPFCRRVLAYHFPNAIQYEDIKTTDFRPLRGCVDVLTGGFPCQPFSLAGKRKGTDDNRYLWPEMLRAIRELAPRWVVGENVFGIVNWSDGLVFEQVCADLENEGYEVQPYLIPACAVNAPHRRDRVWFVAHRRDAKDTFRDGFFRDLESCETESDFWEQRKLSAGDSKRICREAWVDVADGSNAGFELLQREGAIGVCSDRESADAIRERLEGSDKSGGSQNRLREHVRGDFAGCHLSNRSDVANALRERSDKGAKEVQSQQPKWESIDGDGGQQYAARRIPNWERFPTQSPVCGRNDGLSARLDACPVPEWKQPNGRWRMSGYWRRESIKAYGNAVVPQVVLKIFETINEYENN